jgi:hypothetical protein
MDTGLVSRYLSALTLQRIVVPLIDIIGLYCNITPEKIPGLIRGFFVMRGGKPEPNYTATSEPNTTWGLITITVAACDLNITH